MDWVKAVRQCCGLLLLVLAVAVTGCAGGGSFDRDFNPSGVKRFLGLSEFYLSSRTTVRVRPDRSAPAAGVLSRNTKVKETDRNEAGWSKVKTLDGAIEGWLPFSVLSKEPVSSTSVRKRSTQPSKKAVREESGEAAKTPPEEEEEPGAEEAKPEPAAREPVEEAKPEPPKEAAPAVSQPEVKEPAPAPKPAPEPKSEGSGGILAPAPASGATTPPTPPPSKYRPPADREGRPESFEPF